MVNITKLRFKNFAKPISQFHSIDISLHQDEGYDFKVDNAFRENVAKFLKNENK